MTEIALSRPAQATRATPDPARATEIRPSRSGSTPPPSECRVQVPFLRAIFTAVEREARQHPRRAARPRRARAEYGLD